MNMQMGSLAEWFSAIATLLAVVIAFWVAFRDGRLRMSEDKKRQADAISAWEIFFGMRHDKPLIYVSNASRQPIHDVMISYGVAYGAGSSYATGDEYVAKLLKVPPGDYWVKPPKNHGGGMHIKLGISISFRDNAGHYWRRDARGVLSELKQDSFVASGVSLPVSDWANLDPVSPLVKP